MPSPMFLPLDTSSQPDASQSVVSPAPMSKPNTGMPLAIASAMGFAHAFASETAMMMASTFLFTWSLKMSICFAASAFSGPTNT